MEIIRTSVGVLIRSHDYWALKDLQFEHEKIGRKVSFSMFDQCQGIWQLKVEVNFNEK